MCASIPYLVMGQEPSVLWMNGYGGNSAVAPHVSTQRDGGFIVAIGATSNIGIDSLCTISSDIVVFFKYNSDASVLEWTKCYRNNFSDSGFIYMFSTPSGGNVLGAMSMGSATHRFLIHKEDAAGTILWSKSYGDGAEALLDAMIATSDGGYVMTGRVYYTDTNFTVHYGSWMDEDIAVIKVDSNGNKVWSKVIGGSSPDIVGSVVNAPDDGCYLIGTTVSTDHDFASNHGGNDGFLVRLDTIGNIIWTDCIGGTEGDGLNCGFADGKGGVILAGTSNSLDGDRTHFPSYGCPVWVLEVDSNKNVLWNNCYGGGGGDCYDNSICKAVDGSIWVACLSTTKGGQVDTQYGRDDAWFLHIDSVGDFLNSKVLGSHMDDVGMMVYPLSNGDVIAGGFYGVNDGSFNSMHFASANAFLTVFAPSDDRTIVPEINLDEHNIHCSPNPATTSLTITSSDKINSVTISNLIEQAVYSNYYHSEEVQVDVSRLPVGMYIVRINGIEVRKFIKQ